MNTLKLIVFLLIVNVLSAEELGGYFLAKIGAKNYHFYLGESGSYLYQVGDSHSYILKNESPSNTIKTYEIYDSLQSSSPLGKIKLANQSLLQFELNKIKAKKIKLVKLKIPIQSVRLSKQIYTNAKCSFKFVNLNDIHDADLSKEVSIVIAEIMNKFKSYECDYLKAEIVTEMNATLNQMICEPETVLLKDRFYGINFLCKANLAKSNDFKYQVFSLIYDKDLRARVLKTDFTESDLSTVDDSKSFNFRLTPVGLGLYSTDMVENGSEILKVIPYFNLNKNFKVWGKPKQYLNNFALK